MIDLAHAQAPATPPMSCPRCEAGGLGEVWCCWELVALKALMAREATPTMSVVRAALGGRSPKAIDNQCRRRGWKIPLRDAKPRRRRCAACRDLFTPIDATGVCAGCVASANAQHERRRSDAWDQSRVLFRARRVVHGDRHAQVRRLRATWDEVFRLWCAASDGETDLDENPQ
jgi:hypothetical protein